MELFNKMIAAALKVSVHQVDNTLSLLGGGATIPFISRYRKEATGGLDEVQIGEIKDRNDKLCELAKRKETILSTIEEQGKLTEELRKRIEQSWDATEVEDIYLPYKPKRKTRAEAARQKGLEPLATLLLLQRENHLDSRLPAFVKGDVKDEEDALKGARDIIAEQVSEDERARNQLRNQFSRQAVITSKVVKGKEEEAAKYRDYFDFSEPLKRCSSHRLLAIRRGESEGLLKVSISPDDEECAGRLEQMYVRGNNECSRQVGEAVRDAYKRLLKPSIETEFSALSKEKADEEARNLMATFQESGWLLFGVGAAITLVPMLVAVCVGLFVFKINILDLLGTITGGMTSTPGLAAADSMTDSNIPSVAYATVYPIAMVFLILIIQVIASAVY